MAALIIAAFVLVVTMFLTMARFGLRKFLGYSAIVDILFTILMFMMFAGTFSGIVAGAFAGMFMTLLLYVLKGTIGYERLELTRCTKIKYARKLAWVQYPPAGITLFKGAFT